MKISFNNNPGRVCSKAGLSGKFYYAALLFLSCVSMAIIPPVYAAGREPANLALQVTPATIAAGGTVLISTSVTTNRFIKIGMLIYRLSGPNGEVHYLQPTIIRDFQKESTHQLDTHYDVGTVQGNWSVSGYLCIGKCEVKGEDPPRNAAVTVTGSFTVLNNSSPPLSPGSGPLSFPQ